MTTALLESVEGKTKECGRTGFQTGITGQKLNASCQVPERIVVEFTNSTDPGEAAHAEYVIGVTLFTLMAYQLWKKTDHGLLPYLTLKLPIRGRLFNASLA